MGEQIQTQHQPQPSQSLEEPPNSHHQEPPPPPPPTSADFPQTPSTSSKIPIRPQKIRKLSSTTSLSASASATSADESPVESIDGEPSSSAAAAAVAKTRRRNSSRSARVLPSVIKPLSSDGEIDRAIRHLHAADPLLASLIDSHPPPIFETHHPPFLALTRSILYQQLANKAGTAIYARFLELCGGEDGVRPEAVLALSTQQLRQIGISGRKAIYLYDLANKYISGILSDNAIVGMDDKSLFTMLTMVKGIGAWSVHMFMIFSLHRPDVLPVGDMGVRKGVQLLYALEELPRPSQMEEICEKWRPYRSVGTWYMWRFVEGKGAQPGGEVNGGMDGIVPLQQVQQQMVEQQQQHQLQLLEPISSIANFGYLPFCSEF